MQARSILQDSPGLEYVQELGGGAFGALWLARLTKGPEVGRLVVARRLALSQLDGSNVERILAAIHNYSSLTHPSLVKILGGQRTNTALVLLEEHVIGVPLSKLQELALSRQISIPIHVGTKLVLDALRASLALRQGCRNQGLLVPGHTIFPDSVIVANFGEALLSGIGVTEELSRCRSIRDNPDLTDVLDPVTPVDANGTGEFLEVFTAGALLWKLLLIRGLFENYGNQQTLDMVLHSNVLLAEYDERLNLCVPKPIADIIRHATRHELGLRYPSLQEMAAAIEALPSQLLAGDSQVRGWVDNIAGDYLSDIQHSSGVRRVPMSLRSARASNTSSGRRSYIPTLPGFQAPGSTTAVPFWPEESDTTRNLPSVTTNEQEVLPVAVKTTGFEQPRERRPIRNAFVLGTLVGLASALCFLYMSSRIGSRPAAAGVASAPMPAKLERIPMRDKAPPLAPTVSAQTSHTQEPPGTLSATAEGPPQVEIEISQGSKPDTVEPSNTKRSKRVGSQARARAGTSSRAANSGSSNRWGI